MKNKKRKGFSFIEIGFSLALIGFLTYTTMSFLKPKYENYILKESIKLDLKIYLEAIYKYKTDGNTKRDYSGLSNKEVWLYADSNQIKSPALKKINNETGTDWVGDFIEPLYSINYGSKCEYYFGENKKDTTTFDMKINCKKMSKTMNPKQKLRLVKIIDNILLKKLSNTVIPKENRDPILMKNKKIKSQTAPNETLIIKYTGLFH